MEKSVKISAARLKQIIKEELFYREFHRETKELVEVETEKQQRYMCAMKADDADRPKGLSQDKAEEMCTAPVKETLGSTIRRSATAHQNLETIELAKKTQQSLIDQLKASEDPGEQEKIERRLKLLLQLISDLKLG